MQQNNHLVYLNMKQVKKEQNPDQKNEEKLNKVTKLAIGKPGGADFSGEEYELQLSVRCLACNITVDYEKNPQLSDLVKSILNASSVNQQNTVSAWEEEIHPCEHTLTLQQNTDVKIASKMTSTCKDCNLSQNLWLCLVCGYLGCGRKFYDGSGGNNHAVEHAKNSGHPLVVKTGTITPSGDASIYCYTCENDVKDEMLPQHLKNFGIDINLQQKTEKTMTEMNLEFNLNLTLSKTIEDGKILVPIYGEGNTGMENIGNSCYMNSIVQILFSLENFKEKFLDDSFIHLTTCLSNPEECFNCQVSKLFFGLYSGNYSKKLTRKVEKIKDDGSIFEETEEYQKGIKPFGFKYFFASGHSEFMSNKQQDAFEYLNYLLDKFNSYVKNKGLNVKLDFEFDLELRFECLKCHCCKYKNQQNWYLPFFVPNWEQKKAENSFVDLNEVLEKFLSPEILEMNCENCKETTNFNKTQKVLNFPKYFIVLFQRFVYDWVPLKLDVQLKFDENNINYKILSREHKLENEKILDKTNEKALDDNEPNEIEVEPEFDKDNLNTLIMNGVPELAAKHALLNSNNNPEEALMWFFSNLENDLINQPVPKIKKTKNAKKEFDPNFGLPQSTISMLTDMGFTNTQAVGALKKNGDNAEKAMEFLFDNPEFDFENFLENLKNADKEIVNDLKEINKNNNPEYSLYGFVTHLGKNSDHGHYVCHLKKEGKWTYFNDSRVNISEQPPIEKGYIYFFKGKN